MMLDKVRKSVGATIMQRAQRYERMALKARQNPMHVRLGYTVGTLFVFLGILDVLSTNWALSVGAYELNTIMRTLMDYTGPFWVLPKLILQCMIAAMIVWSPNIPTIGIMTIMCAWTSSIVTNNFVIAYSLSGMA